MKKIDEKSGQWVKLFKSVFIILCGVTAVISLICGLGDSTALFMDIELGGGDGFPDLFAWIVPGVVVPGMIFIFAMVTANIATNIQIIRELAEKNFNN